MRLSNNFADVICVWTLVAYFKEESLPDAISLLKEAECGFLGSQSYSISVLT